MGNSCKRRKERARLAEEESSDADSGSVASSGVCSRTCPRSRSPRVLIKAVANDRGDRRPEMTPEGAVPEGMGVECVSLERLIQEITCEGAKRDANVCENASVNVVSKKKRGSLDRESVSVVGNSTGMNEATEWRRIKAVGDKLRSFLLNESTKVSKYACETILGCVNEYEGMLGELRDNACLRGRVSKAERMREATSMETLPRPAPTFARVVVSANGGVSVKSVNASVPAVANVRPSFALVVKGKKNESSEQVRERVIVNGSLNVRVKSMRPARNGGFVIETVSERERECLRKCDRLQKTGLSVDEPRASGPRMIVYDVPNEMMSERFMKELYEKNVSGMIERPEMTLMID